MSKLLLAVVAAVVAVALWWRKNPSACPYSQRFWVQAPHPLITRARLREALAPQPGERMLEVGPGTGYYSLPVAEWLGPDGTLEIFDLQQEMLDHTSGRAREAGLANVVATQGDARALPYGDDAFDGAFLVTVLGEVPDQEAALRARARRPPRRPGGGRRGAGRPALGLARRSGPPCRGGRPASRAQDRLAARILRSPGPGLLGHSSSFPGRDAGVKPCQARRTPRTQPGTARMA